MRVTRVHARNRNSFVLFEKNCLCGEGISGFFTIPPLPCIFAPVWKPLYGGQTWANTSIVQLPGWTFRAFYVSFESIPPASGRKFHLLLRWKGSEAWRAIKLYRHAMTGASYRAVVVQGISTTAVSVAREWQCAAWVTMLAKIRKWIVRFQLFLLYKNFCTYFFLVQLKRLRTVARNICGAIWKFVCNPHPGSLTGHSIKRVITLSLEIVTLFPAKGGSRSSGNNMNLFFI